MKKVLLTTSAIVALAAPAFADDPTPVSDQPYFHHSHPMNWTGEMSITLGNMSTQDAESAILKGGKKNWIFQELFGDAGTAADGEEGVVGAVGDPNQTQAAMNTVASSYLSHALSVIVTDIAHLTAANFTAMEDVIDDYLGGSFSEAYDVLMEGSGNGTGAGSDLSDMADDLAAFQAAQDAGGEGVETTSSINTTASLGVSMSAGDSWTAATSGTVNLGTRSVAGGTMSLSNGMLKISVGTTAHAASAAVSRVYGMDRTLNTNAGANQLQATMSLGGAQIQVDNEMDGDNLETTNQTVGIKGAYGTMSYGLGWEADGDLGFSIGTSLGNIGLTISRINTGSTYSMGLGAKVDLGGGMTLNASNAQNSDGLTDVNFNYGAMTGVYSNGAYTTAVGYDDTADSVGTAMQARAVHKSISSVGLEYKGGGTSVSVTYREKAGTSATGDNLVAKGEMAISPVITLTGSYDKDAALTTIGAKGPLGKAGNLSATMTSTGSSSLTASFKF